MDDLTALAIRSACTDLITRYAMAVNEWDLDAFVALFTDDAIWQRPGVPPYRGHAEILAFMQGQPTDRVLRHVNGGVRVEVLDHDHARAWSQTTVYDTRPAVALPAPMRGPAMVVEYRDQLVRLEHEWRFARRDTTVVFRAE